MKAVQIRDLVELMGKTVKAAKLETFRKDGERKECHAKIHLAMDDGSVVSLTAWGSVDVRVLA